MCVAGIVQRGGAIANDGGTFVGVNCHFSGNSARYGDGGAFWNGNYGPTVFSTASFSGCTFSNNSIDPYGSGPDIWTTNVANHTNVTFIDPATGEKKMMTDCCTIPTF
jgi:hypothetical protein